MLAIIRDLEYNIYNGNYYGTPKDKILEKLDEALQKEVKLKCGGRVIIEETKAFVSIDVDSGEGYNQGGFHRLNNEAAVEIAKQIILRNDEGVYIVIG